MDLLSFFGSAAWCLIPTNSHVFINTSGIKDTGVAFWDDQETACKKFKRNVCGRTKETGGFSSINPHKIKVLKKEEIQQQEAMLMEEKREEENK